jgi:hypothetical protein
LRVAVAGWVDSTDVSPRFTTWLGPRADEAGFTGHDLADHKPIEQMTDRGEPRPRHVSTHVGRAGGHSGAIVYNPARCVFTPR